MSDAGDNFEEKVAEKTQEENGEPEQHQTPAPENAAVHSDDASENQPKVERQRHQRGGRKPKGKARSKKPWSERNGRLDGHAETQSQEESENEEPEEEEEEDEASDSEAEPESHVPKSFQTGFKAFNLKRADETAGGRPVGISSASNDQAARTKSKSKKKKMKEKEKEKSKTKKKKKKKKSKSEDNDSESETSSSEDDEPEPRKPVAIRLDLNLELEIFLRAKVKGDITITFLE